MNESILNTVNELSESTNVNSEMKLDHVITYLTVECDEQTAKTHILDFCMQSSSNDILKYGMEYFYLNGHYEELRMLIDKNAQSENDSNRKWAKVYELSTESYIKRESLFSLTHRDILKQSNSIKTDEPELICLIEFLKLGVYNQMSEFNKIGNFLDIQSRLFEQISDQFLKKSFRIRLCQNLFIYHWVRNELIVARKYAFQVLNLSSNISVITNMHMSLGLTYTFDTYNQGIYHLNEALYLSKKYNLRENIKIIENHNIPFLSAHFNQVEGITTTDKSERAHIEIAKGNFAEAKKILYRMEIDSPFKMYYLGVAKQDRDMLLRSYTHFIEKRSDYFFCRLPLNVIKHM